MSDLAAWQRNNEIYLSKALKWLQLRLIRLAERIPPDETWLPQLPATVASPGRGPFGWVPWKGAIHADVEPAALAKRHKTVTDSQIKEAAAAMEAAEAADPPPALVTLSRRFGLSRFEKEILLLCAAMELDTGIAALCARAQGNPKQTYPTFALALMLFDDPAWEVLSPEHSLRFWRLIEINQPGAQPLTTSALRGDERIVNYIKGLNYLDDRLAPLLTPVSDDPGDLPSSQQYQVDMITEALRAASGTLPIVQLLGADTASKRLIAARAAQNLKVALFALSAEMLPAPWGELETLSRLWRRESLLLPVALYLDAHDAERASSSVDQFVSRSSGLLFLDAREPWPDPARDALTLDVRKPTRSEQMATWGAELNAAGADIPEAAEVLSNQFDLNVTTIRRIVRTTVTVTTHHGPLSLEQLWRACLVTSYPHLGGLAQRLKPMATWDDLVLPESEKEQLCHIAAQVRDRAKVYGEWGFGQRMNRGLGISALFAGESGTGKTMAAEVLASGLRLDLYRIDLSTVVSKYIGETEKNLRRLFDAFEDGGGILFFDEADALFGKRSEVKDSHDRYANVEIDYLLQRMESYRGLAILATNMKDALDAAFKRRIRFIVNFPFPGVKERKQIWKSVFPPQTPIEGLNYDWLARLSLSGGSIQNVALNAAFLAAQAGTKVTMPLVLEAARTEFRKLDKPMQVVEATP